MSITLSEIDRQVIKARIDNPCATLEELAPETKLTRERKRQILNKYNLPTRHYIRDYYCLNCGKLLKKATNPRSTFCNQRCEHEYCYIKIACDVCGKLKEYNAKWLIWQIERNRLSGEHFSCSRKCRGIWHRKWDYTKVGQLRDETGWGSLRISRALQIPRGTVSNILSKIKGD